MKICFLIDDYSAIGGIQRVVPLISSALCDYHEVFVASMYDEYENNNKTLYDKRIELFTLIQEKKEYIRHSIKVVKLLKDFIKLNGINTLIASSEMLVPYVYLATKDTKVGFVCWTHTPALSYDESFLQRPFKWLGAKKADYIIALTEKTKNLLRNKYKTNNIIDIPNPIDPKLMKEVEYNVKSKRIISVGRICYQKYYEKLIEVANIVLKNNPDWFWDIYGDGINKNTIEKLIIDNHLVGRVNLMGNSNNMYELYKNYAIQVLTSRFEGFPMTLLEGMANGLPLVSFNVNGVDSIIKNEKNGYLIEPFDEKLMAEKINILIDDEELRKKLSKINIELRKEYSIENVIKEWNKMLLSIKK